MNATASASPTTAPAPQATDSRYFSPMFAERGDDSPPLTSWAERVKTLEAQPLAADEGAELFARLWGADRYVARLTTEELARVCEFLDFVTVAPNQEVIGQDELGDYMVVVLDGTLAVDRIQPWGGRSRLAEARAGDMLGEMSLLDAGARFSACTTLGRCQLAVIRADQLDRMMAEEPRLALSLVASLSRRLSLRLRQVSARLSALLSRG